MHFQCKKQDLLPAINLVQKAVATQSTLEILTGIKIEAKTEQVILTSTNLELGIETTFPAHVSKHNQIAVVDGKIFAALVPKLPDEPIIFELNDNVLNISAGTVEFSLNVFIGDDFPNLPAANDYIMTIPAEKLNAAIKNVIYACGKDDKRPYLSGILFELEDNNLRLVSTDINRLSYYSQPVATNTNEKLLLLVPTKTFAELQRSIPHDKTEIKIGYVDNQIIFTFNETKFTSRLIDDQFPNYKHLFPKEQPIELTVKKQILASAVERAALFESDGNQIVIFNTQNGVLEITTPETAKGKIQEQINVEHRGENGSAAFQARYILEMLKASDAEQVTFGYNSDLRQCLLQPVGEIEHLYILMPIRLH
ncbi:MAG: DNA polymerase III subunit beta [Firmicutes bacterium]|nr:DNA polymerase III subunit beta [Bacillota bacterium]